MLQVKEVPHDVFSRMPGLLAHPSLKAFCHVALEACEACGLEPPEAHDSGYRGRQLPKEAEGRSQ